MGDLGALGRRANDERVVQATFKTLALLGETAAPCMQTLEKLINLDRVPNHFVAHCLRTLAAVGASARPEEQKSVFARISEKIRVMTLGLAESARTQSEAFGHYSPEALEVLDFSPDAVTLDDLRKPLNAFEASAGEWAKMMKGEGKGKGKHQGKGKGSSANVSSESLQSDESLEENPISDREKSALETEYLVAAASLFAMGFVGIDTTPLIDDLIKLITRITELGIFKEEVVTGGCAFVFAFAGQVSNPLPALEVLRGCMDDALLNGSEVLASFAVMALGEFGRWQHQVGRKTAITFLRPYVSTGTAETASPTMEPPNEQESREARAKDPRFQLLLSGSLRILGHDIEHEMIGAEDLMKQMSSNQGNDQAAYVLYAMKGFSAQEAEKGIEFVKPILEHELPEPHVYYSACRTYIDFCRTLNDSATKVHMELLEQVANKPRSDSEFGGTFPNKSQLARIFAKAALREFKRRPQQPKHS